MGERVIIKVDGKTFSEPDQLISLKRHDQVAKEILKIASGTDKKVVVLVGGENLFPAAKSEMGTTVAYSNEALGSFMNGEALLNALKENGANDPRLMTLFKARQFAEPYILATANSHLEKGRIVVVAGGTMNGEYVPEDFDLINIARELECNTILQVFV